MTPTGEFELYDLRVEVVAPPGARLYCSAQVGDWFELRGESLWLPPGQTFSIYSLAALLPLLPAKQRPTDPNDWMSTDAEVACPDPNCPSRFRITRLGKRTFRHADDRAAAMTFDERTELAPGYEIARVIRGGWQLAGDHGPVDHESLDEVMLAAYDAGFTTLDCADIYTGVEGRIGDFRAAVLARFGAERLARLKVHTKFVPDLAILPRIDRAYVRGVIDRSLQRLRVERLDLVQFHWWDYAAPAWEETALWLVELQAEGKIDLLGATNFDTAHLEALIAAGAPIRTLQTQYSLLDTRPEQTLVAACRRLGVSLLCYGALAGGFLSERWLGAREPTGLSNRSLIKYRLIIDDAGGWPWFQDLLAVLSRVARRHGVTIAAVAARHVLDRPGVAAVIIGARGGEHLADTVAIGSLTLTDADSADIAAVLARRRDLAGDAYALERDRSGRHGSVMKYNLSSA